MNSLPLFMSTVALPCSVNDSTEYVPDPICGVKPAGMMTLSVDVGTASVDQLPAVPQLIPSAAPVQNGGVNWNSYAPMYTTPLKIRAPQARSVVTFAGTK